MSFGKDLQREREQRDVSLESIAEATKVSTRYLRALEADDHAQLPGGVFNKGIVRSYCVFLGLNEEEWLERWSIGEPVERSQRNEDWKEFAANVKRTRPDMSPQMRRRWWGVLLLLVLLAALGWAVWHFIVKPRMGRPDPNVPVSASLLNTAPPTPDFASRHAWAEVDPSRSTANGPIHPAILPDGCAPFFLSLRCG